MKAFLRVEGSTAEVAPQPFAYVISVRDGRIVRCGTTRTARRPGEPSAASRSLMWKRTRAEWGCSAR